MKSGKIKSTAQVNLEKAGRFDRWRLFIYGGAKDTRHLKLLKRIKENYYKRFTSIQDRWEILDL